jgi:hypothetical protein
MPNVYPDIPDPDNPFANPAKTETERERRKQRAREIKEEQRFRQSVMESLAELQRQYDEIRRPKGNYRANSGFLGRPTDRLDPEEKKKRYPKQYQKKHVEKLERSLYPVPSRRRRRTKRQEVAKKKRYSVLKKKRNTATKQMIEAPRPLARTTSLPLSIMKRATKKKKRRRRTKRQ